MRQTKIVVMLMFITKMVFSQTNLVIDPSMEDTAINSCAVGDPFTSWYVIDGSPDYFNRYCWNGPPPVPQNIFGYQEPHAGDGYYGVACYNKVPPCNTILINAREVIQGTLVQPLKKGKKYCVEFWVSAADSFRYAVNNLGAYLTDTSYSISHTPYINFQMPFNRIPQVINEGTTNPLLNEIGWTKVEGSFIAEGGEKYILITNFNNDSDTDTTFIGGATVPTIGCNDLAYYYIDDVSVYCCDADSCADAPLTIAIYPNPNSGEFIIDYGFNKEDTGELLIHNMLGQLVYKEKLPPYVYSKKIILPNIASGVYYLNVKQNKDIVYKSKMVLAK